MEFNIRCNLSTCLYHLAGSSIDNLESIDTIALFKRSTSVCPWQSRGDCHMFNFFTLAILLELLEGERCAYIRHDLFRAPEYLFFERLTDL